MRWNHTVNSKESCWLLWRSRFCVPRMTPSEESFWLLLGLLLRRVILTLYKDLFWLLQGSFETTLRRVKKQINSSKELFWPLFWVISTLILGHSYSYFGSFVLLFWVISTLIMGNFYSYFGSFLPWLGIISTHILVILRSLVRVKLPSTWFMNMHTQESIEVLVNNLLSTCYDNTILNI